VTHEETALVLHTGDTHIANRQPGKPVRRADRGLASSRCPAVRWSSPSGPARRRRPAHGITTVNGTASLHTIRLGQPAAERGRGRSGSPRFFGGDAFYQPASASATAKLRFLTGRAFGLSANINLLLLNRVFRPTPDTGQVRTAAASSTTTTVHRTRGALLVISADVLCVNVTHDLAPGTSTATRRRRQCHDRCSRPTGHQGDRDQGDVDHDVRGGQRYDHDHQPDHRRSPGESERPAQHRDQRRRPGANSLINEQVPVPGADKGLTVNALHLTASVVRSTWSSPRRPATRTTADQQLVSFVIRRRTPVVSCRLAWGEVEEVVWIVVAFVVVVRHRRVGRGRCS